jgi:predicted AAA+ superfamily ATPase
MDGIITKDIITRYGVRNPDILRRLLLLLAERVGKRMTYNKLSKVLGVTPDTVKQYVGYLEETYLIRTVSRHARSLNERIFSPKKVYMTDVGIKTVLTGYRDKGSLAENLVFLKLDKEEDKEIFYYHEGSREIDFVYGRTAVEVKYKDNLDERDLKPLVTSRFKKKILITKVPITQKGLDNVTLVDYLM